MPTHQELDARSLALHRLIAERIRQQPALFEQVGRALTRRSGIVSPDARPHVLEWERAFCQGMDAALALATEESERAAALRQSSPFAGVLSPQERWAFLKAWKRRGAERSA